MPATPQSPKWKDGARDITWPYSLRTKGGAAETGSDEPEGPEHREGPLAQCGASGPEAQTVAPRPGQPDQCHLHGCEVCHQTSQQAPLHPPKEPKALLGAASPELGVAQPAPHSGPWLGEGCGCRCRSPALSPVRGAGEGGLPCPSAWPHGMRGRRCGSPTTFSLSCPLTSCLVHGGPRLTGPDTHPAEEPGTLPSLLLKDVPSFLETLVHVLCFQSTSRQECIFPPFDVQANPSPGVPPPPLCERLGPC